MELRREKMEKEERKAANCDHQGKKSPRLRKIARRPTPKERIARKLPGGEGREGIFHRRGAQKGRASLKGENQTLPA